MVVEYKLKLKNDPNEKSDRNICPSGTFEKTENKIFDGQKVTKIIQLDESRSHTILLYSYCFRSHFSPSPRQ